jgi:hypothetical protein
MAAQRRAVANHPNMAEWIDETALPVSSPRHLMIPDWVEITVRAGLHRPSDERVRVVAKDLNSCRGHTELHRSFPTVLLRLSEEYLGAINLHAHDASQVPELCRTQRLFVPRERCGSIRNCEHYGDQRLAARHHDHLHRLRRMLQ